MMRQQQTRSGRFWDEAIRVAARLTRYTAPCDVLSEFLDRHIRLDPAHVRLGQSELVEGNVARRQKAAFELGTDHRDSPRWAAGSHSPKPLNPSRTFRLPSDSEALRGGCRPDCDTGRCRFEHNRFTEMAKANACKFCQQSLRAVLNERVGMDIGFCLRPFTLVSSLLNELRRCLNN